MWCIYLSYIRHQVKIEQLNIKWTASLVIGVVDFSPDKWKPPNSALSIKRPSWLIHGDSVFQSGLKVSFWTNQ